MSSPPPSNLEQFLHIINNVAQKTNNPIPPHLTSLIENHALPESGNLEATIRTAGQLLEDVQCHCLFANIVNLCVKDGQVTERSLISISREHLRLEKSDARDVEEAVETRFQCDRVFDNDKEWGLFCAGLLAMAESDQELVAAEKTYLKQFATNLKHIEDGEKLYAEKGEGICEELSTFNNRQKRCFASHAIAIMFIDGQWKGSEQEFLDIVTKRMLIVQFDVKRLMKGLYTLFNVSVFT